MARETQIVYGTPGFSLGGSPALSLARLARLWFSFALAAWFGLPSACPAGPFPAGKLEYNRDIRPILSENCFRCHGPDKNARKAKMRLDLREDALQREAFVPGKPDDSELVRRIFTTKLEDQMPPTNSSKHLDPTQRELLKRWIAQGAEYQPHWSYIPPSRPEVPRVAKGARMVNPIDAFVIQDLATHQLKPAPEADKRTLLRRLSFDLIGLPPTPEEVAAFLKDSNPKAYERQVDRLLKSPHYGERMAVPWLDLARFADTVGYHGDQNLNDFPYRDYVINAFNRNDSFEKFTIEQLAGDLLPNPTIEQRVASGFNRLNMVTREGGAQAGEYLAKYGADRVRTVSTTWLGSTMGCCECHDHKFDPFYTRDFYSLKAFFADVKQWGVYMDYDYSPNPDFDGYSNDHPFPPEIVVDSPYLHRRLENLEKQIAEVEKKGRTAMQTGPQERKAFADWRAWAIDFVRENTNGWVPLRPHANDSEDATNKQFTAEADGSIVFHGKSKDDPKLEFPLKPGWIAAVRVELLPRPEHKDSILIGKNRHDNTTVRLTASLETSGKDKPQELPFYCADADRKTARFINGYEVIGVRSGWKTSGEFEKSPQTAVYLLAQPVNAAVGDKLILKLERGAVACVRVSVTPFAASNPLESGAGPELATALTDSRKNDALVNEAYFLGAQPESKAFANYKILYESVLECRGGRTPTVVTVAWKPRDTRVLPRGNWQNESGEVVPPAVPHFLPQIPNPDGRRLTRMDLARWLVSRENPLTARAYVNRLWKQFFGAGLSAVVDDLGAQGEWPVHPELLDWLAVEFMDSGWDMKHLIKLMVMSATYRESSNPTPELKELDPGNRWLAVQSPRRLEAEFVRDNALAISGLLDPDIGGPSDFPYQPAGYYANLQFPDRDYYADRGAEQYRRGVYAHWQRTFLQPMLANFDAPSRDECTAIRNVSNTPQQVLTLLNDPTFVEAARMFAGRVLSASASSDKNRIDLVYLRALARPAKPVEEQSLESFLNVQRDYYRAHAEDADKLLHVGGAEEPAAADAAEIAAWAQVCRVVLGLHETITRY